MDSIKKNLNYIGLSIVILALIGMRIWPHRRPAALLLAGLGIAAIIVHIILNRSALKNGLSRRSFLYSSNLILIVVLVLAILVLLNVCSYLFHTLLMLIGNLLDLLVHFLIGNLNRFLLGNRLDQEMLLHVSFGEIPQIGFELLIVFTVLFHLETLCEEVDLRILHHLGMPGLNE